MGDTNMKNNTIKLIKFKNLLNRLLIVQLIVILISIIGVFLLLMNYNQVYMVTIISLIVSILLELFIATLLKGVILCVDTLIKHQEILENSEMNLLPCDNENKQIDTFLEDVNNVTQEENDNTIENQILNPNAKSIEEINALMRPLLSATKNNVKYTNIKVLQVPDDFNLIRTKVIKYKTNINKDASNFNNNYIITIYSIQMLLITALKLPLNDAKNLLTSRKFEQFQILSGKYENFIDKILPCNDEINMNKLIKIYLYEVYKEIAFDK